MHTLLTTHAPVECEVRHVPSDLQGGSARLLGEWSAPLRTFALLGRLG